MRSGLKLSQSQACKYFFYNQYVCVNTHTHVQRGKVYSLLILNLLVFDDNSKFLTKQLIFYRDPKYSGNNLDINYEFIVP